MFIIFIIVLSASLAAASAHLYTALTLQAQTIRYAVKQVQLEQYTQGVLAYAIAHVAHVVTLQQQIACEKQVLITCDLFNNSSGGFIQGIITYKSAPDGYLIEVRMSRLGEFVGGVRARIMREVTLEKVMYSCVALDAF
jgi:hypothetical protein